MHDLSTTLRELPWSAMIPIGLLMVVGLLLWAAGRRLLRPGFVIIGLGLGGVVGWMIGDSLTITFSAWFIAAGSAVALGVFAALSYRMTIIAALAGICGLLAPLAVLTLAHEGSGAQAQAATAPNSSMAAGLAPALTNAGFMSGLREILDMQARDAQRSGSTNVSQWQAALKDRGTINDNAEVHLQQIQSVSRSLIEAGKTAWGQTPERLRPSLIASGVIGSIAGLLLGILAPMLGASAVTSLGGSLLWLSGGQVLAMNVGVPASWLPSTGPGWLSLWLITATVGLVIQWTFRKRLADKQG
jgi:hypothetical protein